MRAENEVLVELEMTIIQIEKDSKVEIGKLAFFLLESKTVSPQ